VSLGGLYNLVSGLNTKRYVVLLIAYGIFVSMFAIIILYNRQVPQMFLVQDSLLDHFCQDNLPVPFNKNYFGMGTVEDMWDWIHFLLTPSVFVLLPGEDPTTRGVFVRQYNRIMSPVRFRQARVVANSTGCSVPLSATRLARPCYPDFSKPRQDTSKIPQTEEPELWRDSFPNGFGEALVRLQNGSLRHQGRGGVRQAVWRQSAPCRCAADV